MIINKVETLNQNAYFIRSYRCIVFYENTHWFPQKLNILAFKTAVRWMKIPIKHAVQKSRFPGQWVSFNCAVGTSDDAVLWFKKDKNSAEKLQVIDTKIRLVSTNTFNITSLTRKDRGFYRCKVCGKLEKTILFIEILKGKLALKVTLNLLQKILNFPVLGQYNIYLNVFLDTYFVYLYIH